MGGTLYNYDYRKYPLPSILTLLLLTKKRNHAVLGLFGSATYRSYSSRIISPVSGVLSGQTLPITAGDYWSDKRLRQPNHRY